MSEVTDLKVYREKKLREKQTPVPWHWGQPRTAQEMSREALLLAAAATTGVVTYQLHFVVLPYVCALACAVIMADLVRSAVQNADKPDHPRGVA